MGSLQQAATAPPEALLPHGAHLTIVISSTCSDIRAASTSPAPSPPPIASTSSSPDATVCSTSPSKDHHRSKLHSGRTPRCSAGALSELSAVLWTVSFRHPPGLRDRPRPGPDRRPAPERSVSFEHLDTLERAGAIRRNTALPGERRRAHHDAVRPGLVLSTPAASPADAESVGDIDLRLLFTRPLRRRRCHRAIRASAAKRGLLDAALSRLQPSRGGFSGMEAAAERSSKRLRRSGWRPGPNSSSASAVAGPGIDSAARGCAIGRGPPIQR